MAKEDHQGARDKLCGQAYTLYMGISSGVYRTAGGLVFRVTERLEGGLEVDVLKHGVWSAGRLQMIGLRLEPSTVRLSPSAIARLPD